MLAFIQSNALRRKIFADRASRKWRDDIHKLLVFIPREDLLQRTFFHHHTVHRQRIDQLIREDAACGNLCRKLDGSPEMPRIRMTLRSHGCLLAAQSGALHRDVKQRAVEIREPGFGKIENVPGEPAGTRARFHHQKSLWPFEVLPHFRKLPAKQPAKDWMHVRARVVIREALRFWFAVIAVHRMVQAFAHVISERNWAVAADPFCKQFFPRRHAPRAPAPPETNSG